MIYIENYRCNLCGCTWSHTWDTEDYNNDFTICPQCDEVDFEELNEY